MTRPHVALITNVAAVHMAAFDDLDGIAREKAAIFSGLEPDGVAVINADLQVTPTLLQTAKSAKARIVLFGVEASADLRLTDIQITDDLTIIQARSGPDPLLFKIAAPGRHYAMNALAALAAAQAAGADMTIAALDLANWSPPAGRGQRELIQLDVVEDQLSLTLIDDAFNASPISMAAALEVLAASKPAGNGRKIAILGDMLELGTAEAQHHRDIAKLPAISAIDTIHCVGARMTELYDRLACAQKGEWSETAPDMAARVHRLVQAGDVILIKGSKGSQVSLVVDAIRKLGQPVTRELQGTN